MKQSKVWREFSALPPEMQQQVADFISSLRTRYAASRVSKNAKRTRLAKEPFIGMWRHRKDFADSTEWVRSIRRREWVSDRV